MPTGWDNAAEACLGKECGGLLDADRNTRLRDWWLAKPRGANVPNWDLACAALHSRGNPALVLMEAKAHVQEFTNGAAGQPANINSENRERIGRAISEARDALSRHANEIGISRDSWYQFSNRAAFAWKLASEGTPTALIYLGFTGDEGMSRIGSPLRDETHWRETVIRSLENAKVVPESLWEREIDCGAAPLWLLIRSKPALRQSVLRTRSFEGFVIGEDGLPTDKEFWAEM